LEPILKDKRPIPSELRIVAVLFILFGLGSVISTVVRSMAASSYHIYIGIFGIPACFGLCRFSRGWRTFALCYTWIALISAPMGFVMGLIFRQPIDLRLFGAEMTGLHYIWVSSGCALIFLVAWWQYRVLTSPHIRGMFYHNSKSGAKDLARVSREDRHPAGEGDLPQ
jgi:hypothetical protein